MGNAKPNWLFVHSSLDDGGLDAYAFRILCHIARRSGSGPCTESMPNMAGFLSMDERTVSTRIRLLTEQKWIVRRSRPGTTAEYRLAPTPPYAVPSSDGGTPPSRDAGTPSTSDVVHPPHGVGGHPPHGMGDKGYTLKEIPEGNPLKEVPSQVLERKGGRFRNAF